MPNRTRLRRGLLATVPALLLLAAPVKASASALPTILGGGAMTGTVTFTSSAPSPAVCGHVSFDMAVAFQSGSVTYAGPIDVEADIAAVPGTVCGAANFGAYEFSNATMAGTGVGESISCDVGTGAAQVFGQGGVSEFFFGLGDITCTVNGVVVPHLYFENTPAGVITPTGIDPTTQLETSAAVVSQVLVWTE